MKKYSYYAIIYTNGTTGFVACTREVFRKEFISKMPKQIEAYYRYDTEMEALKKFTELENYMGEVDKVKKEVKDRIEMALNIAGMNMGSLEDLSRALDKFISSCIPF